MMKSGFFTRDKAFYRTFFSLLLVIAAQALISLGVNLADNIMLGLYSEDALSGASIFNQIHFVLQQLVSGVGVGVVVLGAQYWGLGETEPIRRIISLGVKIALLFGLVFWAIMAFIPAPILHLLTDEPEVITEALKYTKIMSFTFVIFSISYVLMLSLQSVQSAAVGTVMSIAALFINISLNYVFIFGHFGAPALGIVGAAIATLVSRIVELAIVLVYILRMDKKLQIRLKTLLIFDFSYLKKYIRVALPVILSGAQWGVAQAAQTAILGHISATAIAANSIAIVVFELLAIVGICTSSAASVTIGKIVGAGELGKLRPYTRTLQMIFLALGILCGMAIFMLKGVFVGFYAVSPETQKLATQFLTVLAISTVGTCYEYPVEAGIIGGGGDTRYATIMDVSFMWIFTIPTAALSAFVFGFPPVVTFCFLKADQILKCLPNAVACNRYKWVRQLTK
jgi:putative MATE family efflux protein